MKECQHCKKCYTDDVSVCPTDGMPTFHTISGEPVLEGKYHLERRLGQGGMGVVYCARHAYLKTQHAIKVILPDLVGNDPQLVTRFRQEALAAAAIRHHNVVSTTDYGVAMGTMPFLVMEYVEGESLHDLLTREGKLPPERSLELITAICSGIGAAHHQGIVHRDLKPLNIMICKDKQSIGEAVKILDFGLAKIKSGELLGSFIQAQTTGLMGSPYYMAPEQWSDEEPDARSDIYSLGVMLFQMLTGDVPFKGSSIPAIMKKHLYDNPPSFAELGVNVTPQIELAVRHTLEKEPEKRTASVEQMIGELRSAIGATSFNGAITGAALPISAPLSILTNPPKAKVFVDNVAVGQSKPDGLLFLEGIQSGNHHLRVSHDGFQDWEDEIFCDEKPRQVVAELRAAAPQDRNAIPRPAVNIAAPSAPLNSQPRREETRNLAATQIAQPVVDNAARQNRQDNARAVSVESQPVKKSFFSPFILAVIGISGLLLLASIGAVGAYLLGAFGEKKPVAIDNTSTGNVNNPPPANSGTPPPMPSTKAEMVKITGGTFKMGRSDGKDNEKPEHEQTVKDFWMDKTEVTNAEYAEFISASGYKTPVHFIRDKPAAGEENLPVTRVSHKDALAFADWRSKRDKVNYRLPSEAEWEYAARNGAKNNLYPWGDTWQNGNALLGQRKPQPVASLPNGKNSWGVFDLIGNVWEWTSSPANLYPGSGGEIKPTKETHYMLRGGGFTSEANGADAATSTLRVAFPESTEDDRIGFRLVRSD